jgi:hypothetical protein
MNIIQTKPEEEEEEEEEKNIVDRKNIYTSCMLYVFSRILKKI